MMARSNETTLVQVPPGNAARDRTRARWIAAGGILGALAASSCCILPLLFVTLGISGAWIGNLTALEPFKPYFVAVAIGFIGLGFWHVYIKAKPACVDGSYCARPQSSVITQTALWLSSAIVLLALTIRWWAPLFY